MNFHGYLLLQKPDVLTAAEWQTVLTALKAPLAKAEQHSQPSHRWVLRQNLAKTAAIIECEFDALDLDANDTTRLCKYISTALTGKYTPAQIKTALSGKSQIFGGTTAVWYDSRVACAAYLAANPAAWNSPNL